MTEPTQSPADRPLSRFESACVVFLAIGLVWFGYHTLFRAAYCDNRMTDYGVYARAAWAVRTGADLYTTVDDNKWHYVYPPPFVLLFLPLADPPTGADRTGYISYELGVLLWYAINVGLLAVSLHWLASLTLPDARRFSRRWWYARLIPFDVCLAGLGFTLVRGQANILLVFLLAGMFRALMNRRSVSGGFWLAAAVCLKVFPALLVLYPMLRNQWRAALGFIAGLVIFLGVLPVITWGWDGAIRENTRFLKLVVAPGFIKSEQATEEEQLLARELHNLTAKDSQSIMAILHFIQYPSYLGRPDTPSAATKMWHWGLCGAMLLMTICVTIAANRRHSFTSAQWLIVLGCLIVVMLVTVPTSHMHYYAIVLPMLVGLTIHAMRDRTRAVPAWPTLTLLIFWGVAVGLCTLDDGIFETLRHYGLAVWATVLMWVIGLVQLFATTSVKSSRMNAIQLPSTHQLE
jgi:alpha-1,2-mannosyltransferase